MDKRLLTIQDISCVGQCSLTVALPVISACGIECAVLPSSVLSNHTAFPEWTFYDLTDEMSVILKQWEKSGITFDTFYTGYVSQDQIPVIKDIVRRTARKGSLFVVDPVMADNGKLYAGFGEDFPWKMATLCNGADVILPNITEACLLLNRPYIGEDYDKGTIEDILRGLVALGAGSAVLTGVSFERGKLGVAVYDGRDASYYFTERLPVQMHGTGDVYSASFTGALCNGRSLIDAASIAADYTVESIRATLDDRKDHWYGVKFEKAIPYLIKRIFS